MEFLNISQLDNKKNIHFIGIGGISMSALALILLNLGYEISGSDIKSSSITDKLSQNGIKIHIGHDAQNIKGADVVVFTAAVKEDNPEMIEARNQNLVILERSTLLGEIMKKYKFSIGVSGTHGKTTTTSMVSLIFLEAALDPTITVGGELNDIGGNLRLGNSDYFITEACEYVESFLEFYPYVGIILNIDADHLDYYRDIEHITQAFEKYANLIPENGHLIANADDPRVLEISKKVKCNILTYSIKNTNSTYYAKNIEFNSSGHASFDIYFNNTLLGKINLNVPGIHNVSNALSAIACSMALGVSFENCKNGLTKFKGVKRRFEYKGSFNEVTVIDDYAHHPTEVKATLAAASKYPHNRIWCIFQPHTYSRTKALLGEFSESFNDVNKLIITDIYAAREKNPGDIHSKDLVQKLTENGIDAIYIENFDDITEYLKNNTQPQDVVITMGAGDVYKIGEKLIENK